ncbi:uncharacterized protein LOC113795084 isoform X2 [Dermatophagoides pteronyssinus]|uniref:uncharacterized protein LOC113795084 isoform X2 n=1 Tax=Dermatophagoides pteronyssinus TaxID=6956 RepID=UPI003F67F132
MAQPSKQKLKKLLAWLEIQTIDFYFIPAYNEYIEMLNAFIQKKGTANIDRKKFKAILEKAENFLMSSELSSSKAKRTLESNINLAKQIISNMTKDDQPEVIVSGSDSINESSNLSQIQESNNDRVHIDFLTEIKNKLSDANYEKLESYTSGMVSCRVRFNLTEKAIRDLLSLYTMFIDLDPDLMPYISQMSDSSYIREKFNVINPHRDDQDYFSP